ncbi:MAG: aromatic amino acid hydroxylase [Flavobacteriaceae bacterium]|nr:aromatic amino acid hydroxylase [Flavobacteriaceae bacterium]
METNEVIDKLPKHLVDLIIEQPYNEYTAQDHAVWRYVMRQNINYLPKVSHGSYVKGLEKTGISIDTIPQMYGMNRILSKIGWAAVAVDGFIPPAAFMEFQAYNVLVIAADIRPLNQIGYTPAPDIIHEAAGHAPIIADSEYAQYLKNIGFIGSKAFSSALDYELFEAIRLLSILKTNPYSSSKSILEVSLEIENLEKQFQESSEMTRLRNLHWWTVEYGLIGDINNPKIYGAGLLSSINESVNCLKENVKKIPYTIKAADYNFDITNQQPQLFVTPDFETLNNVLNEFSTSLSYKRGGLYGVEQAINSANIATIVYSSGLQVSGLFTEVLEYIENPAYIRTAGKTNLCFNNREIQGHSVKYHKDGFGSPCGFLKDQKKSIEDFDQQDLLKYNLIESKRTSLEFESGVLVNGILQKIVKEQGKIIILTFSDCSVRLKYKILFQPEWGLYDMAVGCKIVSAYSGAADPASFGFHFPKFKDKTIKIEHTEEAKLLHKLYAQVRNARENEMVENELRNIWNSIKENYLDEWLIQIELIEIIKKKGENEISTSILKNLEELKVNNDIKKLIEDGLKLLEK